MPVRAEPSITRARGIFPLSNCNKWTVTGVEFWTLKAARTSPLTTTNIKNKYFMDDLLVNGERPWTVAQCGGACADAR